MKPFIHTKDDVGNRRRSHDIHYPPDDIGNRLAGVNQGYYLPENVGNFVGKRPSPSRPLPTPKPIMVKPPKPEDTQEKPERQVYTLKSAPDEKRILAETTVRTLLGFLSQDLKVEASLTQQEEQPCVLVKIAGAPHLQEAVFKSGSSALVALNFLVNKVVNRYPDDRIRLIIEGE